MEVKCKVSELAQQKHEEYKQNVSCIESALSAGICPECGADLELKEITYTSTTLVGWIFKRLKVKTFKDARVVCPNGHKLEHPRNGDRSYPGCCEYGECLNDEIRKYHTLHYGYGDD